jgi:hypothetical protein
LEEPLDLAAAGELAACWLEGAVAAQSVTVGDTVDLAEVT